MAATRIRTRHLCRGPLEEDPDGLGRALGCGADIVASLQGRHDAPPRKLHQAVGHVAVALQGSVARRQ